MAGTVANESSGFNRVNARLVEREGPIERPAPVPVGRADRYDAASSIAPVTPRMRIPRWVQLVGLPLLALLVWVLATRVIHVVFLFTVAALVALLLDPIVRALQRVQAPRGLSVAFVYLAFLAVLALIIFAHRHRRGLRDEDRGDQVQRLLHASSRRVRTDVGRTSTSIACRTGSTGIT